MELAGLDDDERAKAIINRQAFLEWKLVLPVTEVQDALSRLDRAIVTALGEDSLRALGAETQVQQTEEVSPELLLFPETGDSAQVGDSAGTEAAPETDAAGDSASQDEEDDENLLRPFTNLLLTGGYDDKGRMVSYNIDQANVEKAMIYLALDEFQRALPRNVSLQWAMDEQPQEGSFIATLRAAEDAVPDR